MTVLEFAREIIRATRSRSRIVFKPLPQDDPRQRRPDISKAREQLKFSIPERDAQGIPIAHELELELELRLPATPA